MGSIILEYRWGQKCFPTLFWGTDLVVISKSLYDYSLQHSNSTSRNLHIKDAKCGQNQIRIPSGTPVAHGKGGKYHFLREILLSTPLQRTGNKWVFICLGHEDSINMYLTSFLSQQSAAVTDPHRPIRNQEEDSPSCKQEEVFWDTSLEVGGILEPWLGDFLQDSLT